MISVIFPAYNEENGIGDVLERTEKILLSMQTSYEIIVVNDGSKDQTAAIAAQSHVRVISHPYNKGYGAALLTGFRAAKGDILCCLDADGTYPPESIPRLYNYLITHNVDIVSGSRLSGKCKGMPFIRKIGNITLTTIATLLIGKRIHDLSSGMKVFKKSVLQELLPLSEELDFTVRMTLKSAAKNIRFKELPIYYEERKGMSKLHIITHGKMFFQSILYITRDYHPLRLFIPVSLLFIILAFFNLLQLAIRRFMGEISISLTNGLVITGLLTFFGLQILFFGILADMIVDIREGKK